MHPVVQQISQNFLVDFSQGEAPTSASSRDEPKEIYSSLGLMARCIDPKCSLRREPSQQTRDGGESRSVSVGTPMRCSMTAVDVTRETLIRAMTDLVAGMAKALVDQPGEVSV